MNTPPSKPTIRLFFIALFCCFSLGLSLKASFNPVVTYAGGGANTWFLDVKELSNGTFLIAGVSNNLNWLPAEVQVQELPAGSLPTHSGTRVSFILQISGDTQKILRAVHLPPSRAINIRWMRTTEIPGDPTGLLYISGQITGGYFIARLNGNFVDSAPDGFEWLNIVSAANGHEVYQAWDVGSDGRVVYAHGGQSSAQIGFFDPQGEPAKLEHLRASHWVSGSWQRGTGDEFPTATHSGIRLPTDNQSWNDTELFAITPDGNGGIRQGTWPIDIMLTHSFETGEPFNVINGRAYGYNGYRAEGRHWIGAVSVDRRNNHFYFGYNIKSILAPGGGQGENPDFEPAVIGYDDEGRMKWWNRLYREAADTTGDGLIDTTWRSEPDQYIDGMAVDYSVSLEDGGSVVVVARCHGNNVSNFWSGNNIALRPGANGFQNRFTGNEGNIHIGYIARLRAQDGNLVAASYLAGFFRMIIGNRGNWPTQPYPEPIHDGWPNHNAGWADVTTTRITENSVRIGPDGRVYMVGMGPRMVTTSNAFQKLPRRLGHNNPILNEGTSPWNNWVRAYEPMLDKLAYSSVLTGVWTYPDGIDGNAVGADNTRLRGVFPISGGLITVGFHGNTAGTSAAGNDIPTADVPSWGSTTFDGVTGIFALLPFDNQRPRPEFTQAVNGGVLSVDANATQSASAVIEALWDFGDGQTGSGLETSHSYAAPGRYLVGVTVINEEGLRASTHRWVEISEVTLIPSERIPQLRMSALGLENMRLAYQSRINLVYQLQTADSPQGPWIDSGAPIHGDGNEIEVNLPDFEGNRIFYRLKITAGN